MKKLLLAILLISCFQYSHAQFTRYIVKFKNKGGASYTFTNPSAYLSSRSITRRTRYGIPIDSSDLPVNRSYITAVGNINGVTILNVSKWMNAVTIKIADPAAISTINSLSFVIGTTSIAAKTTGVNATKFPVTETAPIPTAKVFADALNYGTSSFNEIHLHNGEFLHNIGLQGQTMQLAILDGGFFNYTSLRSLDSANINKQILGTWDFVSNDTNVADDIAHGMQCLSTIAANIPGQFIGKAPKASFYLYKTEDAAAEYPIEEFNWVCGAERADSLGADIISSSLGYTTFDNAAFNHSYADMNGNTTIAAMGADLAAKKGLLVFNAAGNDGTSPWKYIATPADADSIVAVGAVSTNGAVGAFSSYGPSSDGQIKPDVASVGVAALVQGTNNTISTSNGTSFACPNMAGLATCLWQAFPEFNNIKIIKALRDAGSITSTPNDRIGYGIPNMKLAFANLLKDYTTASVNISNCMATISWKSKDVAAMRYEIEQMTTGETSYRKIADLQASPGGNLTNHEYSIVNALTNANAGALSFRIKQVIDTSASSFTSIYIDTVLVNLSNSCATTATIDPSVNSKKIYVVPNPSTAGSALVIDKTEAFTNLEIVVVDVLGHQVINVKIQKPSGKYSYPLPSDGWAKGKYIIRLFQDNKIIGTTQLLKL